MTFHKIDLLTAEQFADFSIKVGDVLFLVQPPHTVGKSAEEFLVQKIETFDDIGLDQLSGKQLIRVVLTLTDEI